MRQSNCTNAKEAGKQCFSAGESVSVLTIRPVGGALDYLVPPGGVEVGTLVEVPIGKTSTVGVVWGPGGNFDPSRLRAIKNIIDAPPMREEMRRFLARAAAYTVTPMNAMLKLALRPKDIARPQLRKLCRATGRRPEKLTRARLQVLEILEAEPDLSMTRAELSRASGTSQSVVEGLELLGAIERIEVEEICEAPFLDVTGRRPQLTDEQDAAAQQLVDSIGEGSFRAYLLKGVTGSGKTEVYLEAVAETIRLGRQALVLLPEIALTAQFMTWVSDRFGSTPCEWHSEVGDSERRRVRNWVASGAAQLVVGARSALFLPFLDLGLIVIDEEHDGSYKQEEGVIYNARDMAVLRASLCSAQTILCSATPSLETWTNARSGKYRRLDLTQRYGAAELPTAGIIDMRQEKLPRGRWISTALMREIHRCLEDREQSLLFLNRRGYAPVTICRNCGHYFNCPDCDARLVEHRLRPRLLCHLCGFSRAIPRQCPSCKSEDSLAPVGPGIERLAEEVANHFPLARIDTLSSDHVGPASELRRKIEAISSGAIDIVIGTQLVAKGHNFPLLTLVGVIDADIGLIGADLRGAEKTFQMVRQVSGRAGRVERRGMALLQTHFPDHPVMQAVLSDDDEGFWEAEASEREIAGAPPFGRYAGIIVSGRNEDNVRRHAEAMVRGADPLRSVGAEVFGPAPAPIARIRGRVRYRILVKSGKDVALQIALRAWSSRFRTNRGLHVTIDVDPQNFQ